MEDVKDVEVEGVKADAEDVEMDDGVGVNDGADMEMGMGGCG